MTSFDNNKNRLQHMLTAADRMKEIASVKSSDDEYINKMYVLGFLHDIGRLISNDNHERVGANVLSGYEFSEEIRSHGHLGKYSSDELNMLYLADMTAGPNGEKFSVSERLADIAKRYGKDSSVYMDSVEIAGYLKEVFGQTELSYLLGDRTSIVSSRDDRERFQQIIRNKESNESSPSDKMLVETLLDESSS